MMEDDLKEGLGERIAGYSDEEVKEILKRRSYYNPVAANLAIREAIKRGLIHSEDDLLADEYRIQPLRFSIFPAVAKSEIREKLFKSLSRGLLFASIIPIIYGYLKFREKEFIEASIIVCLSGIWIFFAAKLMKSKQPRYWYLTLVLAALSVVYVAKLFILMNYVRIMDVFVAIVFYGIVFYCLFYLRLLISQEKP